MKACVGIGAILGAYAVYSVGNPGADGYIFGTVLAAIAALAGYTVGTVRKAVV